mmetsp:Transcript_30168/g.59212  ORF Transcript_30168/g.59212 Transcript_30168/m.59212 type:complete len:93 (+) Transcript_30168:964-1242(+)
MRVLADRKRACRKKFMGRNHGHFVNPCVNAAECLSAVAGVCSLFFWSLFVKEIWDSREHHLFLCLSFFLCPFNCPRCVPLLPPPSPVRRSYS